MPLLNKTILVTGAAKRIGRAIALRLHAEGAHVLIHYHQSELEALEVASLCGGAPVFQADLSRVSEITRLFQEVASRIGKLDGLVNNAARFTRVPALEITEQDWDFIHAVNLKATFFCAQNAARFMKQNGGGRIVNLSSLGALRPWADFAHYCSAKAGVVMLTECLAKAFGPEIQVNTVAPGLIPFHLENERTRTMIDHTPMQRAGSADEVADAVAYFLQCPDFITGQCLAVDGGLSLR